MKYRLLTSTVIPREKLVVHWTQQRTMTNIGTAYVNLLPSGQNVRVDPTGTRRFTAEVWWTKVGVGTQSVRCSDFFNGANILFEMNVVSGDNTVPFTDLPSWAVAPFYALLEGKSTTGTDDPIFLSWQMLFLD